MTTLPQQYTPLESVLLFQALRVHGVESPAFTRIASDLKSVPLVRNDPSYNADRLAPDALRQLYLDLLKEEARHDLEKQLGTEHNGDGSLNSRKRKAPSPKLPTVREAATHAHLIPQLLTRLYMRYRELTVASIRQQEARYDELVREDGASTANVDKNEVPSSSGNSEITATSKHVQPRKRTSQARIDDMLNRASDTAKENASHRRSSSGNSMPSLADLAGVATTKPAAQSHQYQGSPTQYNPQAHALKPGISHGSPQMQDLTPRTSASPRPVLPPPPGIAATGMPHPHSPSMYHPQAMHPTNRYIPPTGTPAQYAHAQTYQPQNVPPYGANSRGGVMLPPFQLSTPDQSKAQQASQAPQQQYNPQHQPQNDHGHLVSPQAYAQHAMSKAPSTGPRPHQSSRINQHPLSGVVAALATPPRSSRQPIWKSEKRPPPLTAPGSPKRPDVEPLSPLLARAASPVRRQATRGTRRQTSNVARSASVESTANGSEDTHASTSRRRIKPEQPSTPNVVRDSEEPDPLASQSSGGAGIVNTRKRRGTLSGLPPPSHLKRQRQASLLEHSDDPPPRSTTITAIRNFPRMSAVIMNEIVSHKHGSRFAQPVRDSHAEGYSTFIRRPQDLKSIRAAISQGSKAIAALTTESDLATTVDGGATIELERSVDVMPPKAIVNGAQLEKEILRIFANAVMFNPGEDGMVADAREMFEDIETKVAEWRRDVEDRDRDMKGEDEDAAEEGEGSRAAKRRKI